MDLDTVARDILAFFDREDTPVALIGGLALHAYGIGRTTYDLDLLTILDVQPRLIAFLESNGWRTIHASKGYSNHLSDDPAQGRIDFVYVDEATAKQLFAEAQRGTVLEGIEVSVPRPEHLAAMKIRALANDPERRLQEMADIRRLLLLPEVDRNLIREYFERLGLGNLYEQIEDTF